MHTLQLEKLNGLNVCLCIRCWQYGIGQLSLKYLCVLQLYWLMALSRLAQLFSVIVTINIFALYFIFVLSNLNQERFWYDCSSYDVWITSFVILLGNFAMY